MLSRSSSLVAAAGTLMCVALLPVPGWTQGLPADDLIDQIRDRILESSNLKSLGAGYAAMANFAVVPDISSATYQIDDDASGDPELSVSKIPLKFYLPEWSQGWTPFLQLNLGYQDLEAGYEFIPGEGVQTHWKTRAISLAGGADIPVNDRLTITPVLDVGVLDLENKGNFYGNFSTAILQPAFENLLFNWDARVRLFGASLAFDYNDQLQSNELRIHGTVTRNYLETYSTSSPAVEFSEGTTTLILNSELVIPTSFSILDYPLAIVPQAGYTAFLGASRDELGFSDFFKLGAAAEIDIAALDYGIRKLRLGLEFVQGSDVQGVIFELGYRY